MVWINSLSVQWCYCAARSGLGGIAAASDGKLILLLPLLSERCLVPAPQPWVCEISECRNCRGFRGLFPGSNVALSFSLCFSQHLVPLGVVLLGVIERYVCVGLLTSLL